MRAPSFILAAVVAAAASSVAAELPPPSQTQNRNDESPYCNVAPAPQVGVSEVSRSNLSERTIDILLESKAMQGQQHIAVTLPANYDASGKTRYPVLYLLHGSVDDYLSYYDNNIEGLVGDLPVIVVAPNSGSGNGYINWYGTFAGTTDIAPAWETHHLEEVLPFVEQNFPVRNDRAGRGIAGISMGGGGTMHYAALRPDLFGSAASFSGALNVTREYPYFPALNTLVLNFTQLASGPNPYCAYGDFLLQHVTWKAADATYLAQNLKHTGIWLSCGSGPPHSVPYVNLALDPVELEACEQTEEFMLALDGYGIAHTDDFYIGTHTWGEWSREIPKMLAWLMPRFTQAPEIPANWDYRTAHAAFSVWGWNFAAWRDVREFVYLKNVSANGLEVSGSGAFDVITPPQYEAGESYLVTDDSGTQQITAEDDGRLEFRIDLGPSHERQQLAFTDSAVSDWTHRSVSIAPVKSDADKDSSRARFGGALAPQWLLMLCTALWMRRRAFTTSPAPPLGVNSDIY